MTKVPQIDLSRCVDCEACIEVCPEVFQRNEAGYIEVAEVTDCSEELIWEAIACCPRDCIEWEGHESDKGAG
jgi:ferredoxin